LLCKVTDQNIAFLIPDSCRATVRKGNSISVDVVEDTRKRSERRLFLTTWKLFWTFWQCMINTLYVHWR